MKNLYFILKLALFLITLGSIPTIQADETALPPLRIQELLPDRTWMIPLAIDPAIPEDFIAVRGHQGASHKYIWATPEVAKSTLKEEKATGPLFLVWLSMGVVFDPKTQTFTGDIGTIDSYKNMGFTDVVFKDFRWGSHFVRTCTGKKGDTDIRLAWIAQATNTNVLVVQALYPTEKPEASLEAGKMWEHFLNETKELKGADFYRAFGQEMHEGYTNVTCGSITVKARAEFNSKTDQILWIVEPSSPHITFKVDHTQYGLLGGEWKTGYPLLKIYGRAIHRTKETYDVADIVISVMIKEVENFSADIRALKKKKNVVYQLDKVSTPK